MVIIKTCVLRQDRGLGNLLENVEAYIIEGSYNQGASRRYVGVPVTCISSFAGPKQSLSPGSNQLTSMVPAPLRFPRFQFRCRGTAPATRHLPKLRLAQRTHPSRQAYLDTLSGRHLVRHGRQNDPWVTPSIYMSAFYFFFFFFLFFDRSRPSIASISNNP